MVRLLRDERVSVDSSMGARTIPNVIMLVGRGQVAQQKKKRRKGMLKEFFTRNISLKALALIMAVILWVIARFWVIK